MAVAVAIVKFVVDGGRIDRFIALRRWLQIYNGRLWLKGEQRSVAEMLRVETTTTGEEEGVDLINGIRLIHSISPEGIHSKIFDINKEAKKNSNFSGIGCDQFFTEDDRLARMAASSGSQSLMEKVQIYWGRV
ncbi:hypothetical protein B296_00006493 [Ensete ventricosum]|uniref:Uncharacterized protein n=1 Tax=Ensete ventricosum TaxID=4639 RepID=A0A426ZZ94_ENSVE|nr:hypothetical protein B296_00006493 [Ensete ventricosum]